MSCGNLQPTTEREGGVLGVSGEHGREAVEDRTAGPGVKGGLLGGPHCSCRPAGAVLSRDSGSRCVSGHLSFLGSVAE